MDVKDVNRSKSDNDSNSSLNYSEEQIKHYKKHKNQNIENFYRHKKHIYDTIRSENPYLGQ